VIRHSRYAFLTVVLAAGICLEATPAAAQTPSSSAAAANGSSQAASDDDAALDPMEPDYYLINLPTALRLPVKGGNFHLTHRFNENLRGDSFSDIAKNFFGIDQGAAIGFEFRFGLMRHLEAIASRTNISRTVQLGAKYDAMHQNDSRPVSVSVLASVEGQENFSQTFAPSFGIVLARSFANAIAFYVVPVWVGDTAPSTTVGNQSTGSIGLGTRIRFLQTAYLVGEVTPRLGGYVVGDPEYAFSIEKRVGAHVFSLTFANGQGTTFAQIARGGNPESLYFGFNLTRKFF
jgi:Membrane bound beta barrel domain (DUF5777)